MVIDLRRCRGMLFCLAILLGLVCMNTLRPANHGQPKQTPSATDKQSINHGLYITWKEVDQLFPRYAKATLTDFDSGKSFHVQRRAGSRHADVQPLTAEDTAVMKGIYQGKWSWKRRSVIVTLENGSRIAASMAGMPHGAGAIRGNRFNGHFCLHFRDSTTHGSSKVDPAHQMMIWKSAGIEEIKLMTLPPAAVIETFFTALDQGENDLAGRMVSDSTASQLNQDMASISSVSISNIQMISIGEYKIDVRVGYQANRLPVARRGSLLLLPTAAGWFIDYTSVRPWLQPPGT